MAHSRRSPKPESAREERMEKDDRKRVGKACDRCRLKKSKCDGHSPCNRCKGDDGVCMYGERKKIAEKVYPKGYCDQLVADQKRLIKCVHKLYEHGCEANIPWEYPRIERESNGRFSTHSILKSMDLLQPIVNDEDSKEPQFERFEDDPRITLQRYEERERIREHEQALKNQIPYSPSPFENAQMYTSRSASMSRTSSHGSMTFGTQGPMLNRSHQPNHISIPRYGHLPNGGQAPPTPAESPSRDGLAFQSGMDQVMDQMKVLNQPTFGIRSQSFSGVTQAPGMYTQAYGPFPGANSYGNPAIYQQNGPNPYLQDPNHPATPSMHLSHQGGGHSGPVGFAYGSLPQGQEPPAVPFMGHQDSERIWASASLPTATNPVIGFNPSYAGPPEGPFDPMDYNDL